MLSIRKKLEKQTKYKFAKKKLAVKVVVVVHLFYLSVSYNEILFHLCVMCAVCCVVCALAA